MSDEEIRYRSVAERRLAERLLKLEGQWDADAQTVLTRERQLQERTKTFTKLHLCLQFDIQKRHEEQEADLKLKYPNCPRELLFNKKTKSSQLDLNDPTPQNIDKKRILGEESRSKPRPATNRIISDETLSTLEQTLLATAEQYVRPSRDPSCAGDSAASPSAPKSQPRKQRTREKASSPATVASPSPSVNSRTGIEDIKIGGANKYSSLLMQLRKTRAEVESSSRERSTLQSILAMEGSADLKRTVTRMFADPKNAEAISEEEYDRREKRWEEDRKNQMKHEMALLMDERAAINRELAHFGA